MNTVTITTPQGINNRPNSNINNHRLLPIPPMGSNKNHHAMRVDGHDKLTSLLEHHHMILPINRGRTITPRLPLHLILATQYLLTPNRRRRLRLRGMLQLRTLRNSNSNNNSSNSRHRRQFLSRPRSLCRNHTNPQTARE
jgi:hypothetical protein